MIFFTWLARPEGPLFELTMRLWPTLSSDPERALRRMKWRAKDPDKEFHLLIVQDSERPAPEHVVGMATIVYERNSDGATAEIHDVVVDPMCRGKGLGELLTRMLIADATEYAKAIGREVVIALTSKPHRVAANALYVKLGFVLVATQKDGVATNAYQLVVRP